MSKYENYEICSKCNGMCCRSGGCIISPDQFEEFNKDVLKALIFSGIVMIDWWDGDPREDFDENPTEYEKKILEETKYIEIGCANEAYYLRMREIRDKEYEFQKGSYGSQCILHAAYGKCPIPICKRPYEAAFMVPNKLRIHPDPKVRFYATCNGDNDLYSKRDISASYIKYIYVFEDFFEDMYEYCIRKGSFEFKDTFKFRGQDSINEYLKVIKETKFED
jgi:hypothetical protein